MEPTAIKMLSSLYVYGPLGVLSVLGFLLFFLERKRTQVLTDKLSELSCESIKADIEHSKAYETLERTLDITTKLLIESRQS